MMDPNFQPGDSTAHFQQHAGVLTQPGTTTGQDLLHNSQLQAKLPSLEHDQIGTSSIKSNAVQLTNTHLVDAGSNKGSSDRLLNRGNAKDAADTFDARDTKLLEEAIFSADTQNMSEPVELSATMRQSENLLVGLGIVSAGYLAWAFNGGSLLAGAISATPMWKPFDPLAVLDFNDRASKTGVLPLDGESGAIGEDNLQSLFG